MRNTNSIAVWVLCAATVAHVAFADAPGKPVERPDQTVLRLLNSYRAAAGVGPVTLDDKLSRGCMEHANYMLQNRESDAMVGLNAHHQRADLPGASAAGAACGAAADLFPGVADLATAVDGWMAGFYHRRPMLDPGLRTIGVGYAHVPDGTLMAALEFGASSLDAPGWPVMYPADQQRDIPLQQGQEIPNPIPGGGTGGYPITLQFPPFEPVTSVSATLTEGSGAAVPFYLSDPEHPATSFGQYGVVSLIATQPLHASSTYRVRINATWRGKARAWSWSFSTPAARAVDAANETAILGAIGVVSSVRGTVFHGGMLQDSTTVFLEIGKSEGGRYQLVSVMIPIAVWQQLGHGATPSAWDGATIEVQTLPHIYDGKYINLPIGAAEQLRVITPAPASAP